MATYDFSVCKFCATPGAVPRYRIDDGLTIYCCPSCTAHYVDRLDDDIPSHTISSKAQISEKDFEYIDKELHSNINRFRDKMDLLLTSCKSNNLDISNLDVLDVGAGGGLFMHLLNEHGVSTHGIDPNTVRQAFAKNKYGLEISPHLIEDAYWQDGFSGYFDAVTMWDVIEHVDFPVETLRCANKLLKKDGLLLLDTPMRDALYYRIGMLTYKLTFGKFPSFLNVLYPGDELHKQIISTKQMSQLLEKCGFEVIELRTIHELSLPYDFYLKVLFHSETLGNVLAPFADLFFKIAKIRNKMIVVAKKR